MRTTITLDERVLREAKVLAARSGKTTSAIVEDALRLLLGRAAMPRELRPLPTYGSGGPLPGIDLSDNASVLAAMEEAELIDRPEKWAALTGRNPDADH